MLALRRHKVTLNTDENAIDSSLWRTQTGTLRGIHRDLQIAAAPPRQDEIIIETEAVVSTVSTALNILGDIAGALQSIPYVGAVAIATVKVLEIREELKANKQLFKEVKENVARRMLRLVEALRGQAALSTLSISQSEELLKDLE
jgi:hypothetical protein